MMDKGKYGVEGAITTIIKPTNDCNFKCKYCYSNSGVDYSRMSEETLKNSIKKIAYFNGKEGTSKGSQRIQNHFIWHGGEPLLAGIDFYRKVVEIQEELIKEGYKFRNSIQTNGSLIIEDTVDFFKEHNFSIGLSLDGPKELNDKTRLYRAKKNGSKSTFEDVMSSIELLKRKGLNPKVIVVVNKHNINSLDKIYDFLKQNKLDAKFNPLIKSGRAIKNYQELAILPEEYAEARLKLFKVWVQDENPMHLNCFEDLLKGILSEGCYTECCFKDSCQKKFIAIDSFGDAYPCGEFCGETGFRYGNINKNHFEEILSHPLRMKLSERSKNLEECKNCEYKKFCYGGCMYRAYASEGDYMVIDSCCLSHKRLFDYITKEILPKSQKLNERRLKEDGRNT